MFSIDIGYSENGIKFVPTSFTDDWLNTAQNFGDQQDLVLLLRQLQDEGYTGSTLSSLFLSWQNFYRLTHAPEYTASLGLLAVPPIENWRPSLLSRGTLTDTNFDIVISGWRDAAGLRPNGNVEIEGALLKSGRRVSILPEAVWQTVQALLRFKALAQGQRTPDQNRRAWSEIRAFALAANADLSDFLRKTVVLSPERLRIEMRKSDIGVGRLVEIIPSFVQAPIGWLEHFDRLTQVPDRYEITEGNGLIYVLISPEVKTVLQEVKRMPGRRVGGERAEAFIRNPFAALGPDATSVIDAEQFEAARDAAGIGFASFIVRVRRDPSGYPFECALLIDETLKGQVNSNHFIFSEVAQIDDFIKKLDAKIKSNAQCCHWKGYDLEILGDTPAQLELLISAVNDMREASAWQAAEIFDLSLYSERIEGFGQERPYYSPFIARKNDDSAWFPENVDIGLFFTPDGTNETIAIVLDGPALEEFKAKIETANAAGEKDFIFAGCPKPIPTKWAEDAVSTLHKAKSKVDAGTFDPKAELEREKPGPRRGLVVKPNVDNLDYQEQRGSLKFKGGTPALPSSLRKDIYLKTHQLEGVAWLQHLWQLSPNLCRGALLADDMGLGKTIQLLTFMANVIESDPNCAPFLVVAPVSLLENWKEEIEKFFQADAMKILTLYGPDLKSKRAAKKDIDESILREGVTRLLVPGWIGSANVVLTTYETLRDLDTSLAAQKWSAMICDEAQKIKNPNALVTRSAKKQNARFKIACTGTPVENSLIDIWCLFDFVQPGWLGSMNEFGEKYRKPIEAKTDVEKARLEELRDLIEDQKLRRTKAEVAKDLPLKIENTSCRSLQISQIQRVHYANVIDLYRRRKGNELKHGLQSPLGLVQYLRRLCSDPRAPGQALDETALVQDIERDSPKMAWLLKQLNSIKGKDEKVIVFCEFRDLQRTLQRAIFERFGFTPDVINGDTSADAAVAQNRQNRIKKFQLQKGFGVIVLSPLAVGFGVNIQAANHVVHFTRTWNPAKEDQATDRAYRIGQTKDVHVYYPVIVAHDFLTFDAKLDQLLAWKRNLSTDMLNGASDVNVTDFQDLGSPNGGSAFGVEVLTDSAANMGEDKPLFQ